MANFNAYPTDELMKQLDKLENIDEISRKMVKEAIPIVVDESQEKMISRSDTGHTMDSLMPRGVRKSPRNGVVSDKAIFAGYDGRGRAARHMKNYQKRYPSFKTRLPDGSVDNEGGTPYALKAIIIEHGSVYHKKRPFLEQVVEDSGEDVANKMQAVFNEEMEN